jgi:hypothetical protein
MVIEGFCMKLDAVVFKDDFYSATRDLKIRIGAGGVLQRLGL